MGRSLALIKVGNVAINDAVRAAIIEEVLPELKPPSAAEGQPTEEAAESTAVVGGGGPLLADSGEIAAATTAPEPEPEPEPLDDEAAQAQYEFGQLAAVNNAEGATVGLSGPKDGWKGQLNRNFDGHMQKTMEASWEDGRKTHPGARNVGPAKGQSHNPQWRIASPLSPMNGFYDQRYVCATVAMEEIDQPVRRTAAHPRRSRPHEAIQSRPLESVGSPP